MDNDGVEQVIENEICGRDDSNPTSDNIRSQLSRTINSMIAGAGSFILSNVVFCFVTPLSRRWFTVYIFVCTNGQS